MNSQTGSNWDFKRFERLAVITIPISDSKKLTSS